MYPYTCKDGQEHQWDFSQEKATCNKCSLDQDTYEKDVEYADRIRLIMKDTIDAFSRGNCEIAVGLFVDELRHTHRTLQQKTLGCIATIIDKMKDSPTDLRNEASIQWCKKVSETEHRFPFL